MNFIILKALIMGIGAGLSVGVIIGVTTGQPGTGLNAGISFSFACFIGFCICLRLFATGESSNMNSSIKPIYKVMIYNGE